MFTAADTEAFVRRLDPLAAMRGRGGADAMRAAVEAQRARVLAEQRARSGGIAPTLTQVVDGRRDAPDAAIRGDSLIFLDWNYLREAVHVVATDLRERAPHRTGTLKRGIVVLVDGREVDEDKLPRDASEAHVVSTVPYARRVEVSRGFSVRGFGLFETRAAQLRPRLGGIAALRFVYLDLENAHVGVTLHRQLAAAEAAQAPRLARSLRGQIARRRHIVRYPAIHIRELQA